MTLREKILRAMRKLRRTENLPSSMKVVQEAFAELELNEKRVTPEAAAERFNSLMHSVWKKTLEVLERHEHRVYGPGIAGILHEIDPEAIGTLLNPAAEARQGVALLFERWYPALQAAFLSVSQSRKQRGGKDFELQVERIFELMKLTFRKQPREHRTDFIVPSEEAYNTDRNRAAILSAKRTLRERWREVVEELYRMRCPNVYLLTADEKISKGHVEGICRQNNIYLAVWDEVKAEDFPHDAQVISFSVLARRIVRFVNQEV